MTEPYVYKSPIFKRAIALGEKLGREEGRERGREEGHEEGREVGLRNGLLAVLQARSLVPSAAQQSLIAATHDAELLALWIGRAATARTVDAVFIS